MSSSSAMTQGSISGENSSKSPNIWRNIYSVPISTDDDGIGHKKHITLKQLESGAGSNTFVLADIRAFMNGKPTKRGVCLTPFEYDWLARKLALNPLKELTLAGKVSARTLTVKPMVKGAVNILQQANGEPRRIKLNNAEVKNLIENYGDFYCLIEEMLEFNEEVEVKGVDEVDKKNEYLL